MRQQPSQQAITPALKRWHAPVPNSCKKGVTLYRKVAKFRKFRNPHEAREPAVPARRLHKALATARLHCLVPRSSSLWLIAARSTRTSNRHHSWCRATLAFAHRAVACVTATALDHSSWCMVKDLGHTSRTTKACGHSPPASRSVTSARQV
jgi:hypothetical protein